MRSTFLKYKGKFEWSNVYVAGLIATALGLSNLFIILCLLEKKSITLAIFEVFF